ncbi:MAG: cadherin-like beta sandwich domain-containing protein, partial [Dysgonamonadaceae bacterium]|nr:cadherin-like beta sandwich domain-containing protein [Dysgonamonadaceae bacterium]
SITITAEPNNELVSVSGTDKQPLTVGNSVFHVIVTAEDGEENDYAVSVEKLSCDVSLKFLTVNGDTILPSGDTYNVTVNDMVESATIEAFPSFSGAIVRGEDEKPLNAGNNRFEITVTAENGDEHVYTVNIYRQSGDAALTSITVSPGLLVPEFSPDIFAYTLQISDKEKEFTVETELDSPGAEVSGARTYKTDVQSTVVIKVTAEGGNENIYTLTVDRFSSDATLKSLTLNNGAIPLRFSSDIFEYRVEVEDEVTDITIGGEANHPEATVSGRGPHSLNYGENTFQVTVRAEDTEIGIETSETYTVTVHRISNDPALKSLTIAPAELVPPFDPDITQYTAGVSHQVSSIAIDIETNYPLATCLVSNGDDFGEPGIKPLNVGQNVFGISVFAENKKYYRAYWVRITRGATPTGFHEAGTPAALHVYTANGRLHVDTPAAERVNIYSVTGTLLYSFDKPAGAFRLSAFSFHPASILIVKGSSGWVRKVMM